MAKSKEQAKQVLIVVRPAKRGFIVEVAGSGQLYPCMDAEGIGEAVIEILADPDQESMEFESAAPEPKAEPRRRQAAPPSAEDEGAEEPEGEEPHDYGRSTPEGWTAGDELMVKLLGSAAEKLRNMSWRGK